MKKILALLIISLNIIFLQSVFAAEDRCGKIDVKNINDLEVGQMLKDCKPAGALEGNEKEKQGSFLGVTFSTTSNEGYKIENAKGKIMAITNKLVILATILAIGGIVYAGILFTTAYGKDDKIKKAKEGVKWSLLGLLLAIISQQLINAIINLIYGISG